MNNTEANNNTPNNVRGRGRGCGNERGGRRGRGRQAGTFVFVVDPTVQHNTTSVNNSNGQADNRIPENNNANVENDNGSSRSYNVWPEAAICILLKIMAGTYNLLLRRGDTALKQFIWVPNFMHLSMQRKWKDKKNRFTGAINAARETGVGGTVPNMPYYEEIAKITQDDHSIQPEVIYESVNMEENGTRSYRRSNDVDLKNAIESDGPQTTYLTPTEVDQLVIQKALADRYPTEDSLNPEGCSVPPPLATPTSAPPPTSAPATEPSTPTPTPASAVPPAATDATPPPPYTSAPPPPPQTSASSSPRSTGTSRNSRTSGEQSSSTTDPIEAARHLSDEHMAHAQQLGVEMMDRMAALLWEDREQRLHDVDNM
ncbi:hypothetical protein INT47_012148 [Mucor saturninus]|uniref:Uncharacterized protein n=1 Tax=Mucor saturninus TaxID=64648 RepID=A0A8H7QID8_9FUNG|nr:hypothetical protein INT47_012148 [Mucor saturninus]